MKRILVTGGNGFLGSNVVGILKKDKSYEVSACSRSLNNIDLRDYKIAEKYFKEIKPDVVVHCAAHVGGIAYNMVKPVEIFEDNALISMNTVKACHKSGADWLINFMPNCVYPGHMQEYVEAKWWDGPIHDSVLTYGLPRKMLWGLCFAYKQMYGFKSLHLILPNMYGPNDHFDSIKSHALGALISKIVDAKIKNKKTVEIWGTGKPVREWLFVRDGAEAAKITLKNLKKFESNDILNIGVRKGISITELAEMIKEIVGWDGNFIYDASKPDGAMKKILVADKMKKMLNWEPPTSLRDGIKITADRYYKNIVNKYG